MTDTIAQAEEIERAFDAYRKKHFGASFYPIDAATYFAAGFNAARADRASPTPNEEAIKMAIARSIPSVGMHRCEVAARAVMALLGPSSPVNERE